MPLTLVDLSPANTQRWVIRRKAEVVAAVEGGLLSVEAACDRYRLTSKELEGCGRRSTPMAWQACVRRVSSNIAEPEVGVRSYPITLDGGEVRCANFSRLIRVPVTVMRKVPGSGSNLGVRRLEVAPRDRRRVR
jgi:hypothetical protein